MHPNRTEGGRRLREAVPTTPPLVSIVTVVFRAARELPPLLESIVANRGEGTELIVVDGGSSDGTMDILRSFDNAIDYWISEPDKGIYDAMNKGIAVATGEYILHLNAGDRLRCIPRRELQACLAEGVDMASFAVDVEVFGIHRPHPRPFLGRFVNNWHHQGTFYRRKNHLGYDTQYRVHGDFDLNQRAIIAGRSIRCFKLVIAEMGGGGVSSHGMVHLEINHLVRKNFGLRYLCLAMLWSRIAWLIPPLKRLQDYLNSLFRQPE